MRSVEIQRLVIFGQALAGLPEPAQTLAEHEQLGLFSSYVPDQGGCLTSLGEKYAVDSLGPLCDCLKYDGPPELLSMWLCIFQAGRRGPQPVDLTGHAVGVAFWRLHCARVAAAIATLNGRQWVVTC